jgi:GWxTD domain-containing protein
MKIRTWILAALALLASGCGAGRSVRSLPPEDKQFLSEVRYIITKSEKRVFSSLGPAERAQFIDEFWRKRDPSPGSDENEFRDEYYRRIAYANRVFREGSTGWLTDRGRAYILLGDPERRNAYPSGYTFYDRPMEIWYYRYFTLVFVDYTFSGIFKLEPQSAQQLGIVTTTHMDVRPEIANDKRIVFDFEVRVEAAAAAATLVIDVPYAKLNMIQGPKAGDAIETELAIDVLVLGAKGEEVLRQRDVHPVSLQAGALDQLAKNLSIRLPLMLAPGRYSVQVTLENTADKSQVSKTIKIKL